MKLAEKYKQTEVGLIPSDWDVKPLGLIVDKIIGGGTPSRSNKEYWGNEIPWVTVKDFASFNPNFTQEFITKKGLEHSASHLIPKGTLITSTRMGLGKAVVYDVDVSINQDLKALFPSKLLDTKYLYYWFQKNSELIGRLGSGSTVMGISLIELKNIQFILPTKAEQTAIASALSDADALISSLEKLIAKKRNIKQGAMQKLLQPKEGWVVKKLGEIGTIVTGSTPPTQIKEYWNGSIPWITPTDITINQKDIFHSEREITNAGLQAIRKLPANTLLVTCIASIGKNAILRNEGACNQQINAIIPNAGYSVDYLYFLIENSKSYIIGKAGITATMMISKNEFSEIVYAFPDFNEQTRIATILSDMDTEIVALEAKLDKYRKVKLGIMQNLLTGKIRLI